MSTELAWAAGFFDGEGSFYAHVSHKTNPNPKLGVGIGQKDREVLDRFCAAVGVGNVNGPYEYDAKGRRFAYRAYNRDAETIFGLLLPYLGGIKIAQAEKVLRSVHAS